jgi:hypothetical protein
MTQNGTGKFSNRYRKINPQESLAPFGPFFDKSGKNKAPDFPGPLFALRQNFRPRATTDVETGTIFVYAAHIVYSISPISW